MCFKSLLCVFFGCFCSRLWTVAILFLLHFKEVLTYLQIHLEILRIWHDLSAPSQELKKELDQKQEFAGILCTHGLIKEDIQRTKASSLF